VRNEWRMGSHASIFDGDGDTYEANQPPVIVVTD
jgi:hypothetical protein